MASDADAATKMSKINVNPASTGSHNVGNFALYVTYTNDGKTYYNVSSTTYTISQSAYDALIGQGTALEKATFSGLAATINDATATPTIGGGWYQKPETQPVTPDVPEPATGALALAGVALLFKRRRA